MKGPGAVAGCLGWEVGDFFPAKVGLVRGTRTTTGLSAGVCVCVARRRGFEAGDAAGGSVGRSGGVRMQERGGRRSQSPGPGLPPSACLPCPGLARRGAWCGQRRRSPISPPPDRSSRPAHRTATSASDSTACWDCDRNDQILAMSCLCSLDLGPVAPGEGQGADCSERRPADRCSRTRAVGGREGADGRGRSAARAASVNAGDRCRSRAIEHATGACAGKGDRDSPPTTRGDSDAPSCVSRRLDSLALDPSSRPDATEQAPCPVLICPPSSAATCLPPLADLALDERGRQRASRDAHECCRPRTRLARGDARGEARPLPGPDRVGRSIPGKERLRREENRCGTARRPVKQRAPAAKDVQLASSP